MDQKDRTWLTTGQAAKLCSVTPATVLNWIRRGHLQGVRTPGGHYRVELEKLEPLLSRKPPPSPTPAGPHQQVPMRCWEYLSVRGSIREECRRCIVFRVRAAWCFQIASLGLETGHARRFCPTSCDDCAYYRRVTSQPTNVLVVTADPDLTRLLKEGEAGGMELRFSRSAYEASAVVESFLPAFAVVDMSTPGGRDGSLLEGLTRDPRLPGLKTLAAVDPGDAAKAGKNGVRAMVDGMIEKPFDLADIQVFIDGFLVELLPEVEGDSPTPELKGG
jgi:excisionase family DNA binding protein